MAKGLKTGGGSRKGVPNRTTAAMRSAFMVAFDELGGVEALVRWGRRDRKTFYTLIAKLLPREVSLSGDGSAHVLHIHLDPKPRDEA